MKGRVVLNKFEKIQRAINGEQQAEVPFSFWTHMPEVDRDPEKIAEATYQLYKQYDLDFIKTMNNGMYAVEDYGTQIDFSEVAAGGVAKVVETPINQYEDWKNIPELSIEEGVMNRELVHLQKLLEKVNGEVPVLITVFSPLTTAHKLSQGRINEYIQMDKEGLLHQALEKIAAVTAEFSSKAIEMGAAGIYFASQVSSYGMMGEELYKKYGVPYDMKVLEGANKGWFNTLHAHGNDIMFDTLKDYPVDVFNWHAWETLPGIKEGIDFSKKCVLGGIARMDITNENKNELRHQIYHTIVESEGKRLILSPGCGIRHPFNEDTIRFIQKVKQETEQLLWK